MPELFWNVANEFVLCPAPAWTFSVVMPVVAVLSNTCSVPVGVKAVGPMPRMLLEKLKGKACLALASVPLLMLVALVVSVVADAASPVICPDEMLLLVSVCVPAKVT